MSRSGSASGIIRPIVLTSDSSVLGVVVSTSTSGDEPGCAGADATASATGVGTIIGFGKLAAACCHITGAAGTEELAGFGWECATPIPCRTAVAPNTAQTETAVIARRRFGCSHVSHRAARAVE